MTPPPPDYAATDDTPTVIMRLRQLRREQQDTQAVVVRTADELGALRLQIRGLSDDVQQLAQVVTSLNQILLQRGEWVLRLIERLFALLELIARRAGWRTILAVAVVLLVLACWSSGQLGPLLSAVVQAIGAWTTE